jgi:hypothetical protein
MRRHYFLTQSDAARERPALVGEDKWAGGRRIDRVLHRLLRRYGPWLVYLAVAWACTRYLNVRADLVPKWGVWYPEGEPYVLLQARALLSGHTALVSHPWGAGHDYNWGRGGMHQAWGLGVPLLALPFHALAKLFGAPGFPDDVRFMFFYALTTVVLARALHLVARDEPTATVASAAAAGFVMVYPTFVGLVTSRFLIYEQTIATAALWSVTLLAGILWLLERCTTARLVVVCFAAGFALVVRPTHAVYGLLTLALALLIARRSDCRPRVLLAGLLAYAGGSAIYCIGNVLRFGAPFDAGYMNSLSGSFVNRLTRWGLPFTKLPLKTQAKEMFATLFLLDPVPGQIMMGTPPPAVEPYIVGERWREYYAPTFGLVILAVWLLAVAVVGVRIVRRRLWRSDRSLRGEASVVLGVWGIVSFVVLFVFYSRISQTVTRYASDMYPAMAAAGLCVGMAIVDVIRKRAPRAVGSAHLAIAGAFALYLSTWNGWATHLSHPVDRKSLLSTIAEIDARDSGKPPIPTHFKCNEARGLPPVHNHLEDWHSDCSFSSAMVFAMRHTRCVSFTFRPMGATWTDADEESLDAFRANADTDAMIRCGPASVEGETRTLTLCDPRRPTYLLDGMRLYAVASLDSQLNPLDRLKLMRIEPAPVCR